MTQITRRELLQGVAATGLSSMMLSTAAGQGAENNATAAPALTAQSSIRERLLLDFGWRFHFGHAQDANKDFGFGTYQRTYAKAGSNTALAAELEFKDGVWQSVNLPHDWAVALPFVPSTGADAQAEEDTNAAHGYKPLGRQFPASSVGWYRRAFDIPADDLGKRIWLEFDGVFRDCLVFCNGHIVGRNESGYSSFQVDLTDFLNYGGKNILALRVDASLGEGWFYEGAGIYRHVWLMKTDALHLPQWGTYVRSELTGDVARLWIDTEVKNAALADKNCQIVCTVIDPEGRAQATLTGERTALKGGELRTVEQSLQLREPMLWSLETPQLYTLKTQLVSDGRIRDEALVSFGIRSVVFDAERGLLLNGRPVKLKGTCNHQDHAGVGAAIPDRLHEWRIEQLKSMGSNAYRSSHNPPTPELLDICDRVGMLVIDETRIMSSDAEALDQLERMVRRDRNRPCIILWSLGNEEPQMVTARGARIVSTMKQLVNRLDPSRLCTFAMDKGFDQGVSKVVDVLGFNYRTVQMGGYHERFPDKPIYGSETGSTVGTRGIYRRDEVKGYVRAYDVDHPWWATTAEAWWSYVAARPYIAGGFVWTGFDYRGEPTPYNRWPSVSSHFGILDTCGFPKDNYWYYKAQWTQEPVLHLFPHWNWNAGEMIDLWCHSNLDKVELLVNGESKGIQVVPQYGHVEWRVKYAPGVIEARGYRGDQVVLTSRRETTGAAAKIVLRPDRTGLRADGEDLIVISVEIVDAQGRLVPSADNEVLFTLNGPGSIIGVGNGNPISHEADKGNKRRAFNGLCQAIVQGTMQTGQIRIEAASLGLETAGLTLEAMQATPRAFVAVAR